MKNLLLSSDCDTMIARLEKIKSTSISSFGFLSVGSMLYHCSSVSEAILTGISENKPSLKQKLLRILVLNIMQKMPLGRHSSSRFFSKNIDLSFDYEKQKLIHVIKQFPETTEPLTGEHPVFGKMNKGQWGRFAWIHLDHHLRQFGV